MITLYDLRIEKIYKRWYDCIIKIGHKTYQEKTHNHTKRKDFGL